MQSMSHSYQGLKLGLGLGTFILIAVIWALAFGYADQTRQNNRAEAGKLAQLTAQAFANTAKLSFEVADQALQRLQETATEGKLENFSREALALTDPQLGSILSRAAWIGADGRMRANFHGGKAATLLDVRERPYFQTFAENPGNRLFVSEPLQGKASGQWIILFSRPVIAHKQFKGVVFVGFEANAINSLFQGVEHPHMQTTLLSPARRVIGRSGGSQKLTGEQFELHGFPPGENGLLEAPSPIDQVQRLYAKRSVPGWGMRVFTGYELEAINARYRQTLGTSLLAAALLSALLLAASYLAWQNIRGRERAHHRRTQELQRSQQILNGMVEGVAILDAQGLIQFVNPALKHWLGDALGRPIMAAIADTGLRLASEDGSTPPLADPIRQLCLQGGEVLQGLWLTDDGQPGQWIQLSASPLADEERGITGAIVTLNDHTEEYVRLNELAITQTIFSQMSDGVVITDREGRITRTNPAVRRMSGYDSSELIGMSAGLLHAEHHGASLREEIAQALARGEPWMGRVWITRSDGSNFCCSQSISPVHDARGQIIRHVAVWRDITQQEVQEQQLWRRANFDPLTHLANRQRFEDRLEHTLSQAERHHSGFAVCMLDLDHFKKVNDRLGHGAGDALLREAAQRMQNLVREGDTLARIGGDEFALIAPNIEDADDVAALVEKLVHALARPFLLTEGEARISLSAGIALYPHHGQDITRLLNAADRAVYEAKGQGRNGYVMASLPGTDAAASSKISPTS